MQLVIQGREYDLIETLKKPTLNDLYYIKVKTRTEEYPKGVSLKSMQPVLLKMASFEDPAELLDDAELLLNLRALVYLCRHHAGEKVTLDSANDFPLDEFSFVTEDSDSEILHSESPDPHQARTVSALGVDAPPAREAPTASPTTSRATSPSGPPPSAISGLA